MRYGPFDERRCGLALRNVDPSRGGHVVAQRVWLIAALGGPQYQDRAHQRAHGSDEGSALTIARFSGSAVVG